MTMRTSPDFITQEARDELSLALSASGYSYVSGSTHAFYHYPARFSPDIARAVIGLFSTGDEWVLDPFMGGGTAIIEGLALGRRMLGVDINALAHFVTDVRTTPLSLFDEEALTDWADDCSAKLATGERFDSRDVPVDNLPPAVATFVDGALVRAAKLPMPRQRRFARCALLRLAQCLLDCRDFSSPRRSLLARKLPGLVREMLEGLSEFVGACTNQGIAKNAITGRRALLCRTSVGLDTDPRIAELDARPKLVFTSPPYPGVHVLYHRWQYRGRKETPAPYWIAAVPDGHYESYYTGGSRTPTGNKRYFEMIEGVYRSVRRLMDPRGMVVQLVGFSNISDHLPKFLDAMSAAGFEECGRGSADPLVRRVPHRKWYAKLQDKTDAASELLIFHRPV